MKTKKMTRFSFSDNTAIISLPKAWNECSDNEKLKIFKVLALEKSLFRSLTLVAISLLDIRIIKKISQGWIVRPRRLFARSHLIKLHEFVHMSQCLQWLENSPTYPVQIKHFGNFSAVDELLRGVSFITFLTCDNLYQAFIKSNDWKYIHRMANYLYSYKNKDIKLNAIEVYAVFYWWYSLKCFYASKFPFLFAASPSGASAADVEASINAQIRALTGGDITKEKEIYEHDTYRALTELNEKAREYSELNKKLKK